MDGGTRSDGLVPRRRLFDLLSGPPRVRVVAAPSGFGKTTLLRSWIDTLQAGKRAVVWVALSAEVATRQELWQLVASSAVRGGGHGADAYSALTNKLEAAGDPLPIITEFLGANGPHVLVLDAYEHLRDLTGEIDGDILRLVDAVPGLEVVVTTRAATGLTDDVLAMRGLVRVIGEADLRFTSEEVSQLLVLHAPHAFDAAERIARDTRGYALGVRAVAYGLARVGSMPAFDSNAWQRLVTDDLKSQIADPCLVGFVLDTAVPPYFDRELARQLTDVADVDRALTELAWNGFGRWIPYARDGGAFQYVESVRDVFLAQVRGDRPDRYERNAGLSASWLHRHHDHDLALTMAIDARQYALASSICRSMVVSNPNLYLTDAFERHLRRVPRALLPRYPVIAFVLGMVYSFNPATRGSAAEYFRIVAKHALDDIDRLSPRDRYYNYVGLEVSLRYMGRGQEAGAVAVTALSYLESMPAAGHDELGEFMAMSQAILAYSRFQAGDTGQASSVVNRAVSSAGSPWWRNYAAVFAIAIHGLNGDCRAARAALATIDDESPAPDHMRRMPRLLGIVGQASLCLDEFDLAGALRTLDAGAPLFDSAESWPLATWVTMHARLGMGQAGGEAHRVEEALAATPPRLGVGSNLGTAALLNALAILWLADDCAAKGRPLLRADISCPGQLAPARLLYQLVSGDPASAVRDLTELQAARGHTIRSAAAVDTLGAAAARRAGSDDAALDLLERAAASYQNFGVRAHLMYVPDADLAGLRELAWTRQSTACAAYLADPVVTPIVGTGYTQVLLTRRELEVLRTWARHRTRREVADALFVSPNTVKTQLNSAYRKLGVTTKDAAIQRAIELDLLRLPPTS